jgi:hypothetical protein
VKLRGDIDDDDDDDDDDEEAVGYEPLIAKFPVGVLSNTMRCWFIGAATTRGGGGGGGGGGREEVTGGLITYHMVAV